MDKSFWKNKRVLVTGSNGFVGINLIIELLKLKAKVIAIDKKREQKNPLFSLIKNNLFNIIIGDITDYNLINKVIKDNKIEICFHLAADVGNNFNNFSEMFRNNILGTINILESSRYSKYLKGLILASTVYVYGKNHKLPYLESFLTQPNRPYEISKECEEILAQTYYNAYKLPIAIARFTNTYGPGDINFHRVVPNAIKSAIRNENPKIVNGNVMRDFIYIKDVINSYILLAENIDKKGIKGEIFNFGSQSQLSVMEITKKILKIHGNKKLNVITSKYKPDKKEINKQSVSIKKAQKFLNWEPKYSIENGLHETYFWYKELIRK